MNGELVQVSVAFRQSQLPESLHYVIIGLVRIAVWEQRVRGFESHCQLLKQLHGFAGEEAPQLLPGLVRRFALLVQGSKMCHAGAAVEVQIAHLELEGLADPPAGVDEEE